MAAARMRPGDLILIRTGGFMGRVIRVVTRSPINHVAVVVGGARVIEARPSGASYAPLSDYLGRCGRSAVGVVIPLSDDQRVMVPHVAAQMLGTAYGFLDIVAIGLLQWGFRPRLLRRIVARQNRLICSQLADDLLRRVGYQLYADGRVPQDVTPGDLLWSATLRNQPLTW